MVVRIVILWLLVAAAAWPALATRPAAAQADAAVTVRVDRVVRATVDQTFSVIGRLVARRRGVVAARVSGPVAEIAVQIGDRARAGDPVARIDRERFQWERDLAAATVTIEKANLANAEARLAIADARVGGAEARLALARQELARLEGLRSSAAFSQGRYDDQRQEVMAAASALDEARAEAQEAVSLIDRARAAIKRAQATLALAKDDLDHTMVRAPFDGVITLRHTEAGAYLEIGDPVVTLVDDRDLEVEADVPYNRLAGLRPGAQVSLKLDDGQRRDATVRAVGVEENPRTRTRSVRFTPDLAAVSGLADGQSVVLDLPIGAAREVVAVNKDAVIRDQGRAFVYVVADGVAQPRDVVLGEAIGPRFEVLSGLAPGERVVVRGNERLTPGQAVRFEEQS